MLRITVHDNPRALTFQLEGSLTGPWLRVLEECWQGTLARRRKPLLRVDLTGVTSSTPRARPAWRPCTGKGPSSSPPTA
jgi:hypothetical protein